MIKGVFVAVATVDGNEKYYTATEKDMVREGLPPRSFKTKGRAASRPDAKLRVANNYEKIIEAFLASGQGYLLVVEDDVCLAPGFAKWPGVVLDLGYGAASFGVMSKYLLEPKARKRAMAGALPQAFYPMNNTKTFYYWGGQAMMVSRRFASMMAEVYKTMRHPFDYVAGRTAYQQGITVFGLVPSPIRHLRMKTGVMSLPNLQMVSYRGVYDCPIHRDWKGIGQSWEEREA
jgi:hypothetical protein